MEQLLAILVKIASEAATQAAKDIVSNLIKKLFNDSATTLEQIYSKLLTDMRGIIGEALEKRDIEVMEAAVKALKESLQRILGGIPADTDKELAIVSNDAIKLWHETMRLGDKAMPAFFLTTGLLFIIDNEYQRVQPDSKDRHQKNSLSIYLQAKQYFNADQFIARKIDYDIGRTPLNMDEASRQVGHAMHPGRREPRLIPVYRQHYRHWFDWNGKKYDCGWQTDRRASHGAGINLRDATIRADAKPFAEQIKKISNAWDGYYKQLLQKMQNELPAAKWKEIEELVASYEQGLKSFEIGSKKLTDKEVAELGLSTEPGKVSPPQVEKPDAKAEAPSAASLGVGALLAKNWSFGSGSDSALSANASPAVASGKPKSDAAKPSVIAPSAAPACAR